MKFMTYALGMFLFLGASAAHARTCTGFDNVNNAKIVLTLSAGKKVRLCMGRTRNCPSGKYSGDLNKQIRFGNKSASFKGNKTPSGYSLRQFRRGGYQGVVKLKCR